MAQHLVLPESILIESHIEHKQILPEGTTGYTVPWAMLISKHGERFIQGNYLEMLGLSEDSGGTRELHVEYHRDGCIVDDSKVEDFKWHITDHIEDYSNLIPVKEFR